MGAPSEDKWVTVPFDPEGAGPGITSSGSGCCCGSGSGEFVVHSDCCDKNVSVHLIATIDIPGCPSCSKTIDLYWDGLAWSGIIDENEFMQVFMLIICDVINDRWQMYIRDVPIVVGHEPPCGESVFADGYADLNCPDIFPMVINHFEAFGTCGPFTVTIVEA